MILIILGLAILATAVTINYISVYQSAVVSAPTPVPGEIVFKSGEVNNVSSMTEIDVALASGPVLIEFGAEWCQWCEEEKPIIDRLAVEYPGVTFLSVDTDHSKTLARNFYVNGIPQMNIIIRKNPDGSYIYVDQTGKTAVSRQNSAIVGFRKYDELRPLVDAAVAA